MLRKFSVEVTFSAPVVVFRTRVVLSPSELRDRLGLDILDARASFTLVDPQRERSPVVAALDDDYYTNRQFAVRSCEHELIARSREFCDPLYELSPANYQEMSRRYS